MTEILEPAKIYVCMYAESAAFPHIHFHLIPRGPEIPPERRGPDVFLYLSEAAAASRNLGDIEEAVRIAAAVRARLNPTKQVPLLFRQ